MEEREELLGEQRYVIKALKLVYARVSHVFKHSIGFV